MSQLQIFYPLFAMIALPALMALIIVYVRLQALRRGEIEFHFLEKGTQAPMSVITTTHNLANLFEFPVIFIAAILLIMMFKLSDTLFVTLAWAYVITRYLHSIIHITSNAAILRFTYYAASNLILFIMWMRILILFIQQDTI